MMTEDEYYEAMEHCCANCDYWCDDDPPYCRKDEEVDDPEDWCCSGWEEMSHEDCDHESEWESERLEWEGR